MSPHVSRGERRPRFAALAGTVMAALALTVATGCGEGGESVAVVEEAAAAEHDHATASPRIHTEAAHAFQDEMRKLWEDHVTWTRLAIVSFVDDLSDLEPTVARLLRNQTSATRSSPTTAMWPASGSPSSSRGTSTALSICSLPPRRVTGSR